MGEGKKIFAVILTLFLVITFIVIRFFMWHINRLHL